MRKNAYILHGGTDKEEFFSDRYPSMSNSHWLPWLQKQLLKASYNCQTPDMPDVYKPDFAEWSAIFGAFPVTPQTTLVGHSMGCGFFLRWLAENPNATLEKLVLVAPWLDLKRKCGDFLNFTLPADLASRVREIHVFYSTDEDIPGIKEAVDMVCTAYPAATLHTFEKHGHFCFGDMRTHEFPELLEAITK